MTYWARLTWQVRDPATLAARLRGELGLTSVDGGLVSGALTVDLGTAQLEIRPWQRESAQDRPQASGRLVFEPIPGGEEAPEQGAPRDSRPPLALVGVAWATVELDRAETELDPWLAPRDHPGEPPADDGHDPQLGARTRLRGGGGLPAGSLVLAEPTTEGRLAASLARDGEGPCALYLAPTEPPDAWRREASHRGVRLSAVRPGPLGPASLVLGGSVAGPHLIIVDPSGRSSPGAVAGTIDA